MSTQQQQQQQQEILDARADAALGCSPARRDEAYLNAYLDQLRTQILEGRYTLSIRWLSESYLKGAYDAPDED